MSPKTRDGPPEVPKGVSLTGALAVRTRNPDEVWVTDMFAAHDWSSAGDMRSSSTPSQIPTRQSPALKSRKFPGVGVAAGSTGTFDPPAAGRLEGAGVGD